MLVAANVLNNRVAPRLAPLTSAVAGAALVAMARKSGLTWDELGFHRTSRGAKVGGALACAVAGVYGAGVTIPYTRPLFRDERALSLSRAEALEAVLLQVPVGTVLLEEVAFRGVLHGHLARRHGDRTAIALSSALFGLWHVLPAIDMAKSNPALAHLVFGQEEATGEPGSGEVRSGGTGAGTLRLSEADSGEAGVGEVRSGESGPAPVSVSVSVSAPVPMSAPMSAPAPVSAPVPSVNGVVRTVAGTVVSTGLAGALFGELRRRHGLLGPSMLHLATNSLGYVFARLTFRGGRRHVGEPGAATSV
ncbi:hypothetical protein Ssi02_11010 [Sinosporangium siamense]|uniref:CAAX prenyl protease 2/Lysostaphin resistance protein A-like domain-containing protein n=1 Tax=Sinosporangium siamense TaxID=1367973 RepID=A0A919V3E3_9ACTN|nr:hypothetical protein Ssi02_11010 [Sinosporangium siamense]